MPDKCITCKKPIYPPGVSFTGESCFYSGYHPYSQHRGNDLVAPKPLANTDEANPPESANSSGDSPNTQIEEIKDMVEQELIWLIDEYDEKGVVHHKPLIDAIQTLIQRENNKARQEVVRGWLNWVESGGGHISRKQLKEELAELEALNKELE